MSLDVHYKVPGSARVSRVGDGVLAITDFLSDALLRERLFWRDAKTSARDARATRTSANGDSSINWT